MSMEFTFWYFTMAKSMHKEGAVGLRLPYRELRICT